MIRADGKSQVRQCLSLSTADFWSSLAYDTAEEKPKHCLTSDFLSALAMMKGRRPTLILSLQTPQFFLNRKDGSIVAAFVDNEPKRAAAAPSGAGDLVHLPFGRPRQVQSGEDYVSLDPTAIRSRSEPRRKKSG